MIQSRNYLLAIAVLAGISARPAPATSISMVLDVPTLSAQSGQTVTFRGTIANLESSTVDLNGCYVNLAGQFFTDCGLFLSNAPWTLGAGETSLPFDMFTVTVDVPYTDILGPQNGVFGVLGGVETAGYDPTTQNVLGEVSFSVDVTQSTETVPEPGTAVLGAGALLGVGAMLWRRRASKTHYGYNCTHNGF